MLRRLRSQKTWALMYMESWQAKLNCIHQVCGPILANFPAHHLCHKHTLLYRASMIGLHELCYSFFQQTWPKLVFLGRFGLGFRTSLRKSQEPLGDYIVWKGNGDPYCRTLQFSSGQPVGGALRLPSVVPSKDSTETRNHGLACDTILWPGGTTKISGVLADCIAAFGSASLITLKKGWMRNDLLINWASNPISPFHPLRYPNEKHTPMAMRAMREEHPCLVSYINYICFFSFCKVIMSCCMLQRTHSASNDSTGMTILKDPTSC